MSDNENTPTYPAPYPAREEPGPEGPKGHGGADDDLDPDQRILGWSEKMPPIPDEIREAARAAPDHWLGMVDPTWSGDGVPPDWAQVGRWRSGLDGEIVEWQDNEDYRPSPTALGWPEPADAVDSAVQLAATGYGPGEDVVIALAFHEVAVWTKPGGGPLPALTPEETPVVPVFTSPVHLHAAGLLAFELVKVPDLLDQLPEGHLLYVNPSGPVGMTIEPHLLRERIEGGVPVRGMETAPESSSSARPITTVSGSPDTLTGSEDAETSGASEAPEGPGASETNSDSAVPDIPEVSETAEIPDGLSVSDILGGTGGAPAEETPRSESKPATSSRSKRRPRTTSGSEADGGASDSGARARDTDQTRGADG